MRVWALVSIVWMLAPSAWAQSVQPDLREVREHQIGETPTVDRPYRAFASTLAEQTYSEMWSVRVTVDTAGAVTDASVLYGARDEVTSVVRGMRFRPFERDGRAVPASFEIQIFSRPADYLGPEGRAFPEHIDLATVRICSAPSVLAHARPIRSIFAATALSPMSAAPSPSQQVSFIGAFHKKTSRPFWL